MNSKAKTILLKLLLCLVIFLVFSVIVITNISPKVNSNKHTTSAKIVLDKQIEYMNVNNEIQLNVILESNDISDDSLEWESSNEEVAVVSDGVVIAKTVGEATISVKTKNNETASCKIIVINDVIEVNEIEFKNTSETIEFSDDKKEIKLDMIIHPENATNKEIIWSSSNEAVAMVSDGIVTIVGVGETVITAETSNGKKATCKIVILEKVVNPSEISLNITSTAINLNSDHKTVSLIATISPDNVTDKTVTWTSSNPKVASVSNGVVTALSLGETTVTAKTTNGKTATCKIIVQNKSIDPTKISLNKTSETIYLNTDDKVLSLTATIAPANVTNTETTWTSSNNSVATVSNGIVTAVGVGETTITVKTSNGKAATCVVKVQNKTINPTGVSLNKTSETINLNSDVKTVTLSATVSPANATNKTITWTSSNPSVASISNGVVTALSLGETTVTAKTVNGKTATCKIIVQNKTINPTGISLDRSSAVLYLNYGETSFGLIATVSPTNATDKSVTWTSSNTNVATVSGGFVHATGLGDTVITAKTSNGKTATCNVSVQNKDILPTGVSLNKSSETVYLNSKTSTIGLTATVSPSNATDKSVTWTSSNTSVASVSNGVVTFRGLGDTLIRATTINGKSATFTLTVKEKVIIEVGASQSTRFVTYNASSYTKGNNTYTYDSSNLAGSTLVHINKSGAEISWQYSTASSGGYTRTKAVMDNYKGRERYVEFYLYYLLIGNTIKDSSCTQINNNSSIYLNPLNGYKQASNNLQSAGYNVKTYVVSMHPVHPPSATSSSVVSNTNSNYCSANYRSNWKYNLFNNKIKASIKSSYPSLTYVDTFNQIMDTSSATSSNRKYNYKVTYKCTDGVHWDESTTKMYLKLMLDQSNANL